MNMRVPLLLLGAALAVLAIAPGSAGASIANCSTSDSGSDGTYGSMFGEQNEVVLASDAEGRLVGAKDTGTTRQGDPIFGGVICGNPGAGHARTLAVYLGNKDDSLRSDGQGFDLAPDFGPVVKRIDLILRGGPGDDAIAGAVGGGVIRGGSGDDAIRDIGGQDVISGGSGDDAINAKDGARDFVDCGGGEDTAKTDPFDTVRNC